MSAEKKRPAGSPTAGEPVFLVVAKIRRPHGVRGEMVAEVITDFPEQLKPGKRVFVGDVHAPVTIISQRSHNIGVLLKFEGINTPEEAGRFRNQILSISTADKNQLQIGEYYFHDLLGLQVVDETDKTIGILTEIMETGANDVYVVTDKKGHEILLPAIPDVVIEVDLNTKSMKVHLLPGLMDSKIQQ